MVETRHASTRAEKLHQTELESSDALTCKTVVHFRGLIVIILISRHYAGVLHVIVGLCAFRGGPIGACIIESHSPNDGLPWRLGGPIIVT